MKKAILTAIASGLFILALVFSINTNTSEVTFGEEAFADGTCCPERKSTCIIGSVRVKDNYYKSEGPCKVVVVPVPVPGDGDAVPVNN